MSVSSAFAGTTFWEHLKSHAPKLVPFFKTIGVYFVFFVPSDRPSVFAMVLKCLPIVSLGLFVCLHGLSANKLPSFSRKILVALTFSCFGDAFLIWPSFFPHGMASFAVAQIFYCWAFGFKHPNWRLGGLIFVMNAIGLGILLPSMKDVPADIVVGLPVYSMLLMTMVWRATSRAESFKDMNWTKMCSSLGGISFAISDTILGLSMFYVDIPQAQALVMVSYYLAQLFLALSIINAETPTEDQTTKKSVSTSTSSSLSSSSSPVKVVKMGKSTVKTAQVAQ